jgi:MFS family permease
VGGARASAGAAEGPPASWRDMAVVMSTSTLAGASLAVVFPLATLVMDAAGWSKAMIGANAAMHGLGIFLVAPFIGGLLRRLGAGGCMRAALLLAAATILLMPLAVTPLTWFPLRLATGCASGLLFVISESSVNAMVAEANRGRVIGLYATLFSLGYAAGPLVVAVAGHEGWAPFLLAAGVMLVGLVPLGLSAGADRALRGYSRPHGGLLGVLPRAPLAIATILMFGMVEAAFFALLPLWGLAVGLGERLSALLLTVWIAGNILLQLPIGWLADRLGRRRMLAACLAVGIASLAFLGPSVGTGLAMWPLLALAGAVMGAFYTLSLALLGQAFRGPEQPAANTAFIMVFEIGVVLGPALGGLAIEGTGAAALPWIVIVPIALLLAALPRLRSPVA